MGSKKEPICQIDLKTLLEGFEMTQDEFVDLCILCGCDYTNSIGGLGPVTSYKLLKAHGTIEGVIEKVMEVNEDREKKKYQIPKEFLYKESRALFKNPEVISDKELLKQ